jgi:hypothetical protein
MKKSKKIISVLAASLILGVTPNTNAQDTKVSSSAKVSDAAKAKLETKAANPGADKGVFVKENGPTWVEWKGEHKGSTNPGRPIDKSKIDIKKAATKAKTNS